MSQISGLTCRLPQRGLVGILKCQNESNYDSLTLVALAASVDVHPTEPGYEGWTTEVADPAVCSILSVSDASALWLQPSTGLWSGPEHVSLLWEVVLVGG